MLIRKSKLLVRLADYIARAFFFIPLCIRKKADGKAGSNPKKILIIELWGIGDLAMMSGILKPLKNKFPNSKIYLLSKPVAGELFGDFNYIDKIIFFDFPWTKFKGKYNLLSWNWGGILNLIKKIRNEQFDLAIDARGDLRNNIFLFLFNIKRTIGYGCLGGGYFLTDEISCPVNTHRVDKWATIVFSLGIKDKIRPSIELKEEEIKQVDNYLNLNKNGIHEHRLTIGIHPGAANKIRRWPYERFKQVAAYLKKRYNAKILLFVSSQEEYPQDNTDSHIITVKSGLRQLAAIIKELSFLICNDSGPMHIATAVGTPVIAVFGPGDIKNIGPYGDKNKVIFKQNINCRPCFDHCKYASIPCINNITVKDIMAAADIMVQEIKNDKTNKIIL